VYDISFSNLKSFLWPTFTNPLLLESPVSQTQEIWKFVIHFVAQPTCTNSFNLLQIIQSCSSTMVPGTDYFDIGFYCCYCLSTGYQ